MKYLEFETFEDFAIYENDDKSEKALEPSWLYYMNVVKGYDDGNGTKHYTSATEGVNGKFYAVIRKSDLELLNDEESFPIRNFTIVDEFERIEVTEGV